MRVPGAPGAAGRGEAVPGKGTIVIAFRVDTRHLVIAETAWMGRRYSVTVFAFFFPPLLGQGGFGLFLDRHNLRKYVEECLAQSSSMAGGELKWGSGRTGWDCVGARKGFNGTGLWW